MKYTNLVFLFICQLQVLQIQSERDVYLAIANRPLIQLYNLNTSDLNTILNQASVSAVGLDADVRTDKLFWSDTIGNIIYRMNINGSELETLVNTSILKVEGISWDWINKKLYWTDEKKNTIEVMDLVTGYRKVLGQYSNETKVRGIVVDPTTGWLYWTDWNRATAKIVRMSMDGSGSEVLFDNETVTWPNGLTLDYETQTLYWIDAFRDHIGKSNTDGTNFDNVQNLISGNVTSVFGFGIAFYDGYLYWTDWLTDTVFRVRDGDPDGSVELVIKLGNDPCEISIFHNSAQPLTARENPCDDNNGDCSHLCLLSATQPSGYSCVCPDGVNVSDCIIVTQEPATTTQEPATTTQEPATTTQEETNITTDAATSTFSEEITNSLSDSQLALIGIISGSVVGAVVSIVVFSTVLIISIAILYKKYTKPKPQNRLDTITSKASSKAKY